MEETTNAKDRDLWVAFKESDQTRAKEEDLYKDLWVK